MRTPDSFVNPYGFVPQPTLDGTPTRQEPTYHDGRAAGSLSGSFEIEWTLQSPLLLPANPEEQGWLVDGAVSVPGSSIAGALRSLHEAMFNGCYRVVDLDFVPSYREPVSSDPELQLAVVAKAENGRPVELQLCDASSTTWVDSGDLLRAWPDRRRLPTSGDIVALRGSTREIEGLSRTEFDQISSVSIVQAIDERQAPPPGAVGNRVLLVTSTSARKRTRIDRSRGRALWATGVLTADRIGVAPAALAAFRAAAAGSDDRRRLEQPAKRGRLDPDAETWRQRTTFTDVEWWSPRSQGFGPVARRAMATGDLFDGDVVWVRVQGTSVTEIKLAQAWRVASGAPVRERLHPALHPCLPGQTPKLCLSCATFGAADTESEQQNRQTSYAGHVRFGAARSAGPVTCTRTELAPLGAPHPANGMFYLTNGPLPAGRERGDIPVQWGSDADVPRRPLAGRKFYWHSNPDEQARRLTQELGRPVGARYLPTQQQRRSEMTRTAQLVPAGTKLRSTVAFDQLDPVAVHALLAAVEPGRVLTAVPSMRGRAFGQHLGGGKPFGFGSVIARIVPETLSVTTLAERYQRSAATEAPQWLTAPFPFRDVAARVGRFTSVLPALGAILALDGLGDAEHLVTYPPGAGWDSYQSTDQQMADRFGQSYAYFKTANGEQLADRSRPWQPLPGPERSPRLPVDPNRSR